MQKPLIRIYTDYKSPYAYVANKRLFELEEKHGVALEWLPYTLRIPEFMGTVEERTPHFWRKMRYSYMDARRFANAQGLVMKGPRRIYDAFYSSAGMLFAQRHGLFRPYHDTVFRRFWNHELEIDEMSEISGVISAIGGSASDFEAYVREADLWVNSCASYINQEMTKAGRERFLDRTGTTSMSYHGAINERHNTVMENLTTFRKNLLVLIESGVWD